MLLSASVQAQDGKIRRGPPADWVKPSALLPLTASPSGAIFVRRQDLEAHLTNHGALDYLGYRVVILQPSALQAGNIAISWNPAAGAPTVHDVRVYRGGQAIDVLANTSFDILRRENQLEAAMLDGVLTAVLRVPDLRVGDELEVDITVPESDPTLGADTAGLLTIGQSVAPGRYHLGLSWEDGQTPQIKVSDDLTTAIKKADRGLDVQLDNPTTISPPKDAPPRYQWQRAVQFSRYGDWAALSRKFAPLYINAAKLMPGSPLKAEAARIAAAQPEPIGRAAAALKLVQQDVRYIYVGLNGGNLTPATAEETWQRRYGDCKAKTALLLALLGELGINAEPVIINSNGNDDGLQDRLPIPALFDHVLVRATINGASYWLDATLPPVAGPTLRLPYSIGWYLPLTTQGSPLQQIKWEPPATPNEIHLLEIDARAGFDKPVPITSTTIIRGLEGLKQEFELSPASPDQLLSAFRQQAVGDTFQQIDAVDWRYDTRFGASILTIKGLGIVNWDRDGNAARSLALPGGGFSPPERRVRSSDQDQHVPFYQKPEYDCYVTTVRLPTSTASENWESKAGFDTMLFGRHYFRAWEMRDGAIRMIRTSRVEEPEIDAALAARDNDRIAKFDNSMGYIFYSPTRHRMTVGDGRRVQATYEGDWTRDDAPCLPAKAAK